MIKPSSNNEEGLIFDFTSPGEPAIKVDQREGKSPLTFVGLEAFSF
jgi:hypothetical protein